MSKTVLLDEWHLTFRIPDVMSDADVRVIRRVLNGKAFTAAVRRVVLAEVRKRPAFTPLRVTITR